MARVVVIGGGISGLACARHLADRLPEDELLLLEADSRTGGALRTFTQGGFTWEAGPHGFLNQHPSTLALALRLGLGDELVTGCEQVRRRFVLSGGRLRRFPDSPSTFLGSDLLGVGARLRMLLEPFVPARRGDADETVGAFARRRLGRAAAALLVEPVVSGIYAGDPEALSVRSALPHLAALDGKGRSLLRAFVESRRTEAADAGASPTAVGRKRLVSFRSGADRIAGALTESLGPAVRVDSPVTELRRDGSRWRVLVGGPRPTELSADVVVSAAPAAVAASYLRGVHGELAAACSGIPAAPVAMVALGFREADVPHPLDGFGYLVAPREAGCVLGVLWSTSIFPGHRSPPGTVLLQAILGGARNPKACEADDDELIDAACSQLQGALGVTAAPVLARTHRHRRGIPQYVVGHAQRVQAVTDAERSLPGLFLTGNALRGVGLSACTADAERVAAEVLSHLGVLRTSWPGTLVRA